MKALNVIRLGIWICLSPIVVPSILLLLLGFLFIETLTWLFNFLFDNLDGNPYEVTKSVVESIIDGITELFK